MDQESLKELNRKFNSIIERVQVDYKHDEATYQEAKQIIDFILANCKTDSQHQSESVLMLGKTGWGKSTSINYLSSIPLVVDENGHLKPKSSKDAITDIGGGFSSTTLFPVACKTPFGHVYDMPGDQETRGTIVEMINCICKKGIAKSLKKIKLILVIPASTMTSAGSYGKGLKDILEANNKFLGGINNYKKSIMFLITFSERYPKIPELTVQDILKCLKHQDGALQEYKQLIDYVVNNNQVKFFAKPSEDEAVNSLYTIPDSAQWKQNESEKIVRAVNLMPGTQCMQKNFSVPFNAQMVLALKNIMKICTEKVKTQFLNSFKTLKVSGIQLETLSNFLTQLRTKSNTQLPNFGALFSTNSYLQCPELANMNKVVNFIYEFIKDEKKNQPSYIGNWVSVELDKKITDVLEEIQIVLAEAGSNFKKKTKKLGLLIQPYLEKYDVVSAKMMELIKLYEEKISIETKKNDENSEFFEQYIEKVYDKTIQQPYKVQEKYTVQETRTKKVNTPVSYKQQVPVQKSRIAYKNETEYQTVTVPKTRSVTRHRTETQTHYGGRRYGMFGPKKTWTTSHQVPYQVDEVYYVQEQVAKQVSKPYTEYYTEYVSEARVRYEMRDVPEQVPVEKTRTKTLYRDKLVYRDEKKRRLNQQKYDTSLKTTSARIAAKEQEIKNELSACHQCALKYKLAQETKANSDKTYSEEHRRLLRKWLECEHCAFSRAWPLRSLRLNANGEAV